MESPWWRVGDGPRHLREGNVLRLRGLPKPSRGPGGAIVYNSSMGGLLARLSAAACVTAKTGETGGILSTNEFEYSVELIESGRTDFDCIIGGRCRLGEAESAFEFVDSGESVAKVLTRPHA